jgi:hypothetical protein
MKNNPLFFDSTKFRGDNVIVELHLAGVELSLGESLIAKIILLDGSESLVQMSAHGLRKWKAEARVEYQQRLKLEFQIKKGLEILEKSDLRTVLATYSIYQKWERQPKAEMLEDLSADFDESLINGPTLVENDNGVFEPLKPPKAAIPENRNLPVIVEIKNPKALTEEKTENPFSNENFVSPNLKDLETL